MKSGGRPIHWAEAFGLSALVHVGVVFFALDFVRDLNLFPDQQESQADVFIINTIQLDPQTLATAVTGGADGTEGTAPDTPQAVEPETLAPATPEPEPEPAPEPPAPTLPEPVVPEPVEPEPVTPEPIAPEPVTPETAPPAEALEPIQPSQTLAPAPLSPLRPDEDSVAALAPVQGGSPEALSGTSTTGPVAIATVAPRAETTTRIAPVSNRPQQPPPPPPRPTAPPPAPGSPAAVVSELIQKIRARVDDPCLVAMPQQAADGSPELVLLAADENSITAFATDVLADIEPRPGQRGILIDPRQCPAATYLRENATYPAFRLSMGLVSDVVPDGTELTGSVTGWGGGYVILLLVDDNGVVQDLGEYLTFAGGAARFAVPVRRDGPARDTSQMLIAIASTGRPATLDTQNGQLAEDFFATLQAELGNGSPLVMIPFDVR